METSHQPSLSVTKTIVGVILSQILRIWRKIWFIKDIPLDGFYQKTLLIWLGNVQDMSWITNGLTVFKQSIFKDQWMKINTIFDPMNVSEVIRCKLVIIYVEWKFYWYETI